MRKCMQIFCFVILVSLLASSLAGCGGNTPPDFATVHEHYLKHSQDISTVLNFLISSGYEDISIRDGSGTMRADFNTISIANDAVNEAIGGLISDSAYMNIYKNGNSTSFLQWSGIRDIECGIAYSINGTDVPEIQFATQLTPLPEDGWFYYVADYNAWRDSHGTTE